MSINAHPPSKLGSAACVSISSCRHGGSAGCVRRQRARGASSNAAARGWAGELALCALRARHTASEVSAGTPQRREAGAGRRSGATRHARTCSRSSAVAPGAARLRYQRSMSSSAGAARGGAMRAAPVRAAPPQRAGARGTLARCSACSRAQACPGWRGGGEASVICTGDVQIGVANEGGARQRR